MNLIPDFGMPSVVTELYRIWYEIHTSVFAVCNINLFTIQYFIQRTFNLAT